jgi:chromosome segregation ATPase
VCKDFGTVCTSYPKCRKIDGHFCNQKPCPYCKEAGDMPTEDAAQREIDALEEHKSQLLAKLNTTQLELQKWKNRATCWEKAARNAQSRYERLKLSIEALWDRYAQCLAEDTLAEKVGEIEKQREACRHAQQEGTTGSSH